MFRHHSQHRTCADLGRVHLGNMSENQARISKLPNHDLGDEEILERLLALNLERASA